MFKLGYLGSLSPGAGAELLRVLTSPPRVRADAIRQFYERPGGREMAEVLMDEGIKCRFRGSDLTFRRMRFDVPWIEGITLGPDGFLASPQAGRLYGICDRERPGGPVKPFPFSDGGWQQAYEGYARLEPEHDPVPSRRVRCGNEAIRREVGEHGTFVFRCKSCGRRW
jgi:hypothetical protein